MAYLTGFAVSYQFIGVEGYGEVEVIVYHNLECATFDTRALVLVDGLTVKLSVRSETIAVYPAVLHKLIHKLRSELFVILLRYVAECVFKRKLYVGCAQMRLASGGTPYTRLKCTRLRKFTAEYVLYHVIGNSLHVFLLI